MKLTTLNTGHFKLDGGAMFGVVPKSIWNKLNPADDNNMCSWAMRCMLIEQGNRLMLIDNGIGNKQDAKFMSYYYLHGPHSLAGSLKAAGYSPADVTDMFLTHLHFDHCGGGVERNGDGFNLTFPNATYWSHRVHWEWATKPNAREKASFLNENILPIQESGHLKFTDAEAPSDKPEALYEGFEIITVDGHTEKMMLPLITYKGRKVLFAADLFPSTGHIPLPYVMAYDTRPLLTLQEKNTLLQRCADENWVLFFEHDPAVECATLQRGEKGIRIHETFSLSNL